MDKFIDIVTYAKSTDHHYNTSGFSFYFYGLIKMLKPETVLELGAGVGTTSFLAAQACKENNYGKVITVDNGKDTIYSNFKIPEDFKKLQNTFHLDNFLELRILDLNLNTLSGLEDIKNVNIVFNDIDCGPHYFLTLLSWLLPRIDKECYFIIDQGATYWPNYCAIELTLPILNQGKIPNILLNLIEDKEQFKHLLEKFKFSVQHILKDETSDSLQDSFSVIKIEENNIGYRMI
jgi:SAM-dependent methyltransferase